MRVNDCLPVDGGTLVGRVWIPAPIPGPSVVSVVDGQVYDLTPHAATVSALLARDDALALARATSALETLGPLDAFVAGGQDKGSDAGRARLLAPCDLQAVKACGVTFVVSLVERVIEERAGGDPHRADALRRTLAAAIGERVHEVRPGSARARALKAALIEEQMWSQYMEVAFGPDAEVFTKAQVLSAVGHGAEIGIHPDSHWNNPEPEVVLIVDAHGRVRGATLGNDVNLRDVEGRSALLLGKAKDNNAACAIGPFIRLFDDEFTMDTVRRCVVSLKVTGTDGFVLEAASNMAEISRDPLELVAQTVNAHHHYPDGLVLFLGTMFAPTADRGGEGRGFTHRLGDVVEIATPPLGRLVNRVNHTHRVPPWRFGVSALMENLARRGLLPRGC